MGRLESLKHASEFLGVELTRDEIVLGANGTPVKQPYMTPAEMMIHFQAYRVERKASPYLYQDFGGGKYGVEKVELEREKPLTMEGFEIYLMERNIIADIGHILANTDGLYSSYLTTVSLIRKYIRDDQVSGAMSGVYNANLTARLNNISEKSETKNLNVSYNIEMDLS